MNQINSKKLERTCLFTVITAFLGSVMSSSVYATDEYQYRVLFSPGQAELQAENNGRVMIYHDLKSATINQAMDEQYDRIENMMFVGTIDEQEDGEFEIEDDGC